MYNMRRQHLQILFRAIQQCHYLVVMISSMRCASFMMKCAVTKSPFTSATERFDEALKERLNVLRSPNGDSCLLWYELYRGFGKWGPTTAPSFWIPP